MRIMHYNLSANGLQEDVEYAVKGGGFAEIFYITILRLRILQLG